MQPIETYVPLAQDGGQLADIINNIRKSGDTVAITHNGVPEAINEQVQDYGTGRMIRVLNDVKDSSMEETLTAVRQDMIAYVGNAEQFDDITMLGLTYDPSPAR